MAEKTVACHVLAVTSCCISQLPLPAERTNPRISSFFINERDHL
jgi:hypothetical protein